MTEILLHVNGRRYGGWTSVRVTRSVETLAGSFQLEVTNRWTGQSEPWPIAEEDACRVANGDEVVIDGHVGRRRPSLAASRRSVTISGKDRAAALVECSALPHRWSFKRATVLDIAQALAEPFGVTVSLQPGLQLERPHSKLAVSPGESPWTVIQRAAQSAGVLVVSDGTGGVQITRAGVGRAAPIIEGQNLHAGSVDYSAEQRYRRYVVATQVAGTDSAHGGGPPAS